MKRLPSTLPYMVLSLTLVTALAGALLGLFYNMTKEPIEQMAMQKQEEAIRAVAPAFNNNPEQEKWTCDINGIPFTVYPAKMDGELKGAAVLGSSMNGFSGRIDIMCGFDANGSVTDYTVISHAETPGLGSKMQTWFRDPAGARSVIGKNPETTPFYVVKDKESHGAIDGITAATISSRAFLETFRNAFSAYLKYKEER